MFARSGRRMGKKRMGKKAWSPSCATSRARWARDALARRRGGGAQTVHRVCARGGARRHPLRGEQSEAGAPGKRARDPGCVSRSARRVRPVARHRRDARLARAAARASGARRRAARWRTRRTPSARLPRSPPRRAWRLRSARSATGGRAPRSGGAWPSSRGSPPPARFANARVSRLTPGAARRPPRDARARRMRDSRRKPSGFRGKPNFVVSRERS